MFINKMGKFDQFRRFAGLQTYLPTLAECRAEEKALDVGELPQELLPETAERFHEIGETETVIEGQRQLREKHLKELKLGIAGGGIGDASSMDRYKNHQIDPATPVNKKKAPNLGKLLKKK